MESRTIELTQRRKVQAAGTVWSHYTKCCSTAYIYKGGNAQIPTSGPFVTLINCLSSHSISALLLHYYIVVSLTAAMRVWDANKILISSLTAFFFFMGSVEFSSQTCWQPQTRDRALDNNPTCVGRWNGFRILIIQNSQFKSKARDAAPKKQAWEFPKFEANFCGLYFIFANIMRRLLIRYTSTCVVYKHS